MSTTEVPLCWHLAQSNVARMRYDFDDPRMDGFVSRLDELNRLADTSSGFVWRYESPDDDVTEIEVFGDERILFNLSVWESIEALQSYVYSSDHVNAVRRRADWFEASARSPLVLWWIRAGHRPTVHEAKERFETLWAHGPTADAFTFRRHHPRPETV